MDIDDDKLRAAAERCAELEAWLRLETDPAERDRIEQALKEAQAQLAKEIERVAKERDIEPSRMFPDGNVTDFLKKLDEMAAAARQAGEAREAAQAAEAAAQTREEPHPLEIENEAQELVRELVRELEVPPEIRALPDWPPTYDAALQDYGNVITGAFERGEASTGYDNVSELAAGEEIEGQILAVIERDGAAQYVIEAEDGRRVLAPVEADGPEFEIGDEITASRDRDGNYDLDAGRGYGR